MELIALRELPKNSVFKEGDVFVLFGDLFGKGYANGLVKQAKKNGLKILGVTMGRRNSNKDLVPLTEDELAECKKNLGGEIINIPLEAGFDLEKIDGVSIAETVDSINKNKWKTAKLDFSKIADAKKLGEEKFQARTEQVMEILENKIPEDKNIFFAHTMAGGIIRSKLLFVVANKVFKGKGDRHQLSGEFWESDLGQLCSQSFDSVTANTFNVLINASQKIRTRNKKNGKTVFYSAYGYHGTEIFIKNDFQWQTYVPYQQGHAKKRLENFAREAKAKNINATVFNCPEIRTNSSSIFLGVEIPLFALLSSLKKFFPSDWTEKQWSICQNLLKEDTKIEDILADLENCLLSPAVQECISFENWPTENTLELSNNVIGLSEKIKLSHKDNKNYISDYLSSLILEASGSLIFDYGSVAKEPVIWLGHDIIIKKLAQLHSK